MRHQTTSQSILPLFPRFKSPAPEGWACSGRLCLQAQLYTHEAAPGHKNINALQRGANAPLQAARHPFTGASRWRTEVGERFEQDANQGCGDQAAGVGKQVHGRNEVCYRDPAN